MLFTAPWPLPSTASETRPPRSWRTQVKTCPRRTRASAMPWREAALTADVGLRGWWLAFDQLVEVFALDTHRFGTEHFGRAALRQRADRPRSGPPLPETRDSDLRYACRILAGSVL